MERQAHLRALEDSSSNEDIQAHLLIAKWIRRLVEVTLPEILEISQNTLDANGKDPDQGYADGGTDYMMKSTEIDDEINESLSDA